MIEIIPPSFQFNFVGKRKIWFGISLIAVVSSLILIFQKGLNYGIDFTGGAEIQLQIPSRWDISQLRINLQNGGIHSFRIQQIGFAEQNQYLVRIQNSEVSLNQASKKLEAVLTRELKPGEFEIQRSDVVGPAAGKTLRKKGILAIVFSLICILGYVTLRFDMRYALGSILALLHDSIAVLGVFVLTKKQFDLQVLAALLVLIGYSNNDTMIVFDRIRETWRRFPKNSIEQVVNQAVNDTLGRTLLTSISTFIPAFILWMLGGKVIEDFAFTLMIGIVVGTYSSIFIASSLVILFARYFENRARRI